MDGRRLAGPYGIVWERQREMLKEAAERRLAREARASRRQRDLAGQEPREFWWTSPGGWRLVLSRIAAGLGRKRINVRSAGREPLYVTEHSSSSITRPRAAVGLAVGTECPVGNASGRECTTQECEP